MQPAISVILPVKNGARYIAEALDSIGRQTESPVEVLVVEGGSTDGTLAILRRYSWVRCLVQTGEGLADAWNQGIRECRGDTVAFLDSDDIWMPDTLRLRSAHLAAHPECDAVIGRVSFFISLGETSPPGFQPALLEGTHVASMPGALLARKSLFERIGYFDPSHGVATDIEWFARLRCLGVDLPVLPDLLIRKRVHQANYSYRSAMDSTHAQALLRVLHVTANRKRDA